MKIVILTCWFSENMGYIENCLSKALVQEGHEVHVVSSTAQVYFYEPDYKNIYEPYLGPNIMPAGTKKIDGYTLHRIPFYNIKNKILLKGFKEKLKEINPDVVQSFDAFSLINMQTIYYKFFLKFKFFNANHTVESVFPLLREKKGNIPYHILFTLTRTWPGKLTSLFTSRCYPATIDALHIAVKYYGMPKSKVQLAPLGVDTDVFKTDLSTRETLRKELGYTDEDIVCIYTGRFTEGKNPLCLAKAIDYLNKQNHPFKALFMGNGPQGVDIENYQGCRVHKFVDYHKLPPFYNASDIGVWPKQESTSMIDAAACGLPIVVSNKVQATERYEGNGLTYAENDYMDMAQKLLLLKDKIVREKLSKVGVEKIETTYSWRAIARGRAKDYESFLTK